MDMANDDIIVLCSSSAKAVDAWQRGSWQWECRSDSPLSFIDLPSLFIYNYEEAHVQRRVIDSLKREGAYVQ